MSAVSGKDNTLLSLILGPADVAVVLPRGFVAGEPLIRSDSGAVGERIGLWPACRSVSRSFLVCASNASLGVSPRKLLVCLVRDVGLVDLDSLSACSSLFALLSRVSCASLDVSMSSCSLK